MTEFDKNKNIYDYFEPRMPVSGLGPPPRFYLVY